MHYLYLFCLKIPGLIASTKLLGGGGGEVGTPPPPPPSPNPPVVTPLIKVDTVYQKVLYNSCFFMFLRHSENKRT